MRDILYEMLQESGSLTTNEIILNIVMSAVLGFFIFISYMLSHAGTIYSAKFNVSLVILTILTTTVMTVIGNNVALSLGMVGALSIVRFRTAIKDTRDTIYIFWTIIVGICCGVGDYLVASIGSAMVFLLFLLLGRIKNDARMLLIVRGQRVLETQIESIIFSFYNRKAVLRVKNTTENSVEFIYELKRSIVNKSMTKSETITDSLYSLNGIEYVNLVVQNDEIGS